MNPDSKVHGASMGPIWGRQDPGGPHVGPMNFTIWEDNDICHKEIAMNYLSLTYLGLRNMAILSWITTFSNVFLVIFLYFYFHEVDS